MGRDKRESIRRFSFYTEKLSETNLSLNINKTVFIPFSINKSDVTYNSTPIHTRDCITICNHCKVIGKVLKIRYLGIIFDNNLRWNLRVNNLNGKLRFITYNLVKLKNMIPKQTMRLIYSALYQSNFQYDLLVCGGRRDNISS